MTERIQSLITDLRVAINADNNRRAKSLLYDLEQELMNELGDRDQRIENLLIKLDQVEHEAEGYRIQRRQV